MKKKIKQNSKRIDVVISERLLELVDHISQQANQPRSYIIETYLNRGACSWYEKNEPNFPAYLEFKEELEKKNI